jgi:hypothetical protein
MHHVAGRGRAYLTGNLQDIGRRKRLPPQAMRRGAQRNLSIVKEEADRVRMIFVRYLALGGVNKLIFELRRRDFRTKVRKLSNWQSTRARSARAPSPLFDRLCKVPDRQNAWWRTQSDANLSPPLNSLLGKRAGNFCHSATTARF